MQDESAFERVPRAQTVWALAFVFLSLLALVVIPVLIERRIDDLREETEEVAEPARQWLREAKLAAAWEAASMRGFLLSGDEDLLRLYQSARAEEERAFQHLHPLVRRLGPTALHLIDDLVELARAEEGRLEIEPALVDLGMLTQELAEEHRAAAEAKGNMLALDLPNDLLPMRTDPRRVRQILGNLLSSATKYTPEGGHIRVHADVVERPT